MPLLLILLLLGVSKDRRRQCHSGTTEVNDRLGTIALKWTAVVHDPSKDKYGLFFFSVAGPDVRKGKPRKGSFPCFVWREGLRL